MPRLLSFSYRFKLILVSLFAHSYTALPCPQIIHYRPRARFVVVLLPLYDRARTVLRSFSSRVTIAYKKLPGYTYIRTTQYTERREARKTRPRWALCPPPPRTSPSRPQTQFLPLSSLSSRAVFSLASFCSCSSRSFVFALSFARDSSRALKPYGRGLVGK